VRRISRGTKVEHYLSRNGRTITRRQGMAQDHVKVCAKTITGQEEGTFRQQPNSSTPIRLLQEGNHRQPPKHISEFQVGSKRRPAAIFPPFRIMFSARSCVAFQPGYTYNYVSQARGLAYTSSAKNISKKCLH
jgi:hypothetical protein